MEITEMHIGLCRICIENEGIILLDEFIDSTPISDVIENIFGILIPNNKIYSGSGTICDNCCTILSAAYELKQRITRAETMWKHYCDLMAKEEAQCEIVYDLKVERIDPEFESFNIDEERIIIDDYCSNKDLDESNITAKLENFDIEEENDEYDSNRAESNNTATIKNYHDKRQVYQCKACNKTCKSPIELHRHRQVHCNNKVGEVCEICNKSFTTKLYLKIHMRTHIPDADRRINCEMCEKTFRTKTAYQMHIKHHNGIKDIPCTMCAKLFYHRRDLARHMRTLHLEIKNYSCKLCHKKFSNSGNLYTHMRVHTGEKPYECKYCHVKFNQSSPLNKHMEKHIQNGDSVKLQPKY